ncbi:hypothetical protein [Streptomyces sp. NPDC006132]|uniref:hypothetical protein n=1 Tax=Streptomyces sp. NPDC006132 TaxID=3156732 RepID=UPI0033FDF463
MGVVVAGREVVQAGGVLEAAGEPLGLGDLFGGGAERDNGAVSVIDSHSVENPTDRHETANQSEYDAIIGVECFTAHSTVRSPGEQGSDKEEEDPEKGHENSHEYPHIRILFKVADAA